MFRGAVAPSLSSVLSITTVTAVESTLLKPSCFNDTHFGNDSDLGVQEVIGLSQAEAEANQIVEVKRTEGGRHQNQCKYSIRNLEVKL